MSLLASLFAIGWLRKAIWRIWYPYLTRRLRAKDVLFLNYAFQAEPSGDLPLSDGDEPNRACIQLYDHVTAEISLKGAQVLEISCGHGGGASWLTREKQPASYVGIDLNPTGVTFCRQRHSIKGLTFAHGDAQNLPFGDGEFDVLINVEASHCYPDFRAFLGEVVRVLKPGGHFLYADFRFANELDDWLTAVEEVAPDLEVVCHRDISQDVLRGMNLNAEPSLALVNDCLPRFLHSLGRDFAGVPGARVYEALRSGELSYRSWCFRRK